MSKKCFELKFNPWNITLLEDHTWTICMLSLVRQKKGENSHNALFFWFFDKHNAFFLRDTIL